jgi:hypothetical protein
MTSQPMTMADFAKYLGVFEAKIFALSFPDLCALLKAHGFWITGDGILPKSYGS